MPPFLRRRRLWGLDWFTTREIRHLPWRERERLSQEVWEAVRHHPRYRLMVRFRPLLGTLAVGLVVLVKMSAFLQLLLTLFFLIQGVTGTIWLQRRFYEALRQKLLDAGIRPCACFECGYDVEGYEGKDCPACDAALLRQSDSPPEKS